MAKHVNTIGLHYDSHSAIGRAHSIIYNDMSSHILKIYIRLYISTIIIIIEFMPSKDNIEDLLTKELHREPVDKSSKYMGLKPIAYWRHGGHPTMLTRDNKNLV